MRGLRWAVSTVATATLLAAVALTACGPGGNGSDGSTSRGNHGAAGRSVPGAPPVKESVQDAARRIAGALATGDCTQINALAPIEGAAASATAEHCQSLKNLANLEVGGVAAYGDQGGVIDYRTTEGVISAILVRDSDGLFHVAFLNPFNTQPSVGTPFAKAFDGAVRGAVEALRDANCQAFLRVAYRRFGDGGLPESEVCQAVRESGFGAILRENRHARPVSFGGNGSYAFYGLNTSIGFFTIVAAKETDSVPASLADAVPPLPAGAPTFGYVQAYLTSRATGG
jgi:hypothetical protein